MLYPVLKFLSVTLDIEKQSALKLNQAQTKHASDVPSSYARGGKNGIQNVGQANASFRDLLFDNG